MTYPNEDPNFRREFHREADQDSFTTTTWVSIAFIFLLFGGVAIWAYSSGDMETAAVKRPGVEQNMPPVTTGQGGASSKMPVAKEPVAKE